MVTMGLLLALSFVVSLLALGFLIWAISNKQVAPDQHDARVIFDPGDEGHVESGETATSRPYNFDTVRSGIDAISARPVAVLLIAATVWLVVGSGFGLVSSLKLHLPDWLSDHAPLTFGRVRTLHLNLVIYGWLSQVGIAAMIWILPRIFHTPLRAPRMPLIGAALWNLAVLLGALAIANGWTDGEEWLEIPWQLDLMLALAGFFFMVPLVKTTLARQVHHIYVTGWYFLAGILWFPCLFVIANLPYVHSGVEEATVNWWFAHNVLGLWLTPLGVGELPPVKWSTNRDRIILQFGGPENGWETRDARRHCIETSANRSAARARHDGRGRVTPDRHYGADVLSVAQAIWRNEPRTAEAAEGA